MNRINQALVATSLTIGSFAGISGGEVMAGTNTYGVPEGCATNEIGKSVPLSSEQAIVDAGFMGVQADGIVSSKWEQGTTAGIQRTMIEIGALASNTLVCGYPGNATKSAALKIANPDYGYAGENDLDDKGYIDTSEKYGGEDDIIETCNTITLTSWASKKIPGSDGDLVLDNGQETVALQKALNRNGVSVGKADGLAGSRTKKGFATYQDTKFGTVDCVIGSQTFNALGFQVDTAAKNTPNKPTATDNTTRNIVDIDKVTASKNGNNVVSSKTQECSYGALNKSEVARLLGESTAINAEKLCNEIIEFQKQYASPADGNVGRYTAARLIEKAKNPCNIYGTTINDCAIGIQKNGNNGSLIMVENGKIVMKTSARFGNPGKSNGKKTPEGQFSVQRTKKGEHISTNCDVVCMWNPIYFNGGIAIHGTKTPDNPNGSLGCVGISISKSEMLFAQYEEGKIEKIVMVDFQRN